MAALALEIEHAIDHVLEHAGAGDLSLLGDVADEHENRAGALCEPDQLLGGAPHLGDRPRRRVQVVEIHGLDGIDDHHVGRRLALQARRDIADVDGSGKPHRCAGEAEPGGAHADLLQSLLARDVGDPPAAPRKRRGGLEEQGGLADAGVAREQDGRARHEAAAHNPVDLANPAGAAWRARRPARREAGSR